MYAARNSVLVGLISGLVVGLLFWLVIVLLFGLVVWLYYGPVTEILHDLYGGLVGGVVVGPLSGLIIVLTHRMRKEVKPREIMSWLWAGMWRELMKSQSLKYMLVVWLVYELVYGLVAGLLYGLVAGLLYGLISGLAFELMRGLIGGLSSDLLDKQILTKPNQGIQRSARNSVLVGLVSGLVVGLIAGLLIMLFLGPYGGLVYGLIAGLLTWLVVGSLGGLSIGLSNGGAACIQHVVLRLFLWRARRMPWNYIHFLDYAAERILLRKVGGGYIFVHRLLLEYFASFNTMLPSHQAGEVVQASHPQTCDVNTRMSG